MARVSHHPEWARLVDEPLRAAGRGGGCLTMFDERAVEEARPGFMRLTERERLHAARRAIMDGVVPFKTTGWQENTWVENLLSDIWTCAKDGTAFRITHLEVGVGTGTPARTDVALFTPQTPRKPITEIRIEGNFEYFRTSTYVGALDFYETPNITLREGGLWSALTGGKLYNHLMWSAPLVKSNQACLADITLQLTPL